MQSLSNTAGVKRLTIGITNANGERAEIKFEAANPDAPLIAQDPSLPEQKYIVGAICENAWGYDQTNIDYYIITARKGQFVTLQRIGKKNLAQNGFLSGTCEPDPTKIMAEYKPLRRKVHTNKRTGEEIGIAIESYGWCDLWNGKPSSWTAYA